MLLVFILSFLCSSKGFPVAADRPRHLACTFI